MSPLNIDISLIFVEENSDGSYCSTCDGLIINKMHKLYVSVNSADELGFDLLPTKWQICTPCKIESEKKL